MNKEKLKQSVYKMKKAELQETLISSVEVFDKSIEVFARLKFENILITLALAFSIFVNFILFIALIV